MASLKKLFFLFFFFSLALFLTVESARSPAADPSSLAPPKKEDSQITTIFDYPASEAPPTTKQTTSHYPTTEAPPPVKNTLSHYPASEAPPSTKNSVHPAAEPAPFDMMPPAGRH